MKCALLLAAALLWPVANSAAAQTAVTPMVERVATIAVLDKVSQEVADYEVLPGERIAYRALSIRLVACDATPPWAEREEQGAFVQIDDRRAREGENQRLFSGWLYAKSPSLNSFDHPGYDVWVRSCAMAFPETGPDTSEDS
ncbi:MAG: DUF2155 domain-containing protein [Pacificimonas sp.]|jgi:hypothetical protein|nr:DUF2155 domain-containing protein [Pacificimonas sp.]